MWTDEQLIEQGWTPDQIAQHRAEEAVNQAPVEDGFPIVEDKTAGMLQDPTGWAGLSPTLSAVLIGAMFIMVPFSMYSAWGASGQPGPAGEDGEDGSSFHLVDTSASLPECTEDLNNQIFYVAFEYGFQVCQSTIWLEVNLTGPQGLAGTDGTDGANGQNGLNGINGVDGDQGRMGPPGTDGVSGQDGAEGADGADGTPSLIVTTPEPSGPNCPQGGSLIQTGADLNVNNILENDEVSSQLYLCDGVDGEDGADGSSTATMLVARMVTAPASLGCNGDGQLLQYGMDNGRGNGILLNGILESGEVMVSNLICTETSLTSMTDINPGTGSSNVQEHAELNGILYFQANNGTTEGLYSYEQDGTLTQLKTGAFFFDLTPINAHQLIYMTDNTTHGREPWIYDASNNSTWMIEDINPGTTSSLAQKFVVHGEMVYFVATNHPTNSNRNVFSYNVTTETVDVASTAFGLIAQNSELVIHNGSIYFEGAGNLQKYDPATNVTTQVSDPWIGGSSNVEHLHLHGTTIYFSAAGIANGTAGSYTYYDTTGQELWAYETTNNSTWLVADIEPGAAQSGWPDSSDPEHFVSVDDLIYFAAGSWQMPAGSSGVELWVHDTATGSTSLLVDLLGSTQSNPRSLTLFGDTIYFTADGNSIGAPSDMWAHTILNQTTWKVQMASGMNPQSYVIFDGALHFTGSAQAPLNAELWSLTWMQSTTVVE